MPGLGNTNILSGAGQVAINPQWPVYGPSNNPGLENTFNIVQHFNKIRQKEPQFTKNRRRHPFQRAQNRDHIRMTENPSSSSEEEVGFRQCQLVWHIVLKLSARASRFILKLHTKFLEWFILSKWWSKGGTPGGKNWTRVSFIKWKEVNLMWLSVSDVQISQGRSLLIGPEPLRGPGSCLLPDQSGLRVHGRSHRYQTLETHQNGFDWIMFIRDSKSFAGLFWLFFCIWDSASVLLIFS